MQENVVLCGLRNGIILTIDTRERQEVFKRLSRHRIPYLPADRNSRTSSQQWFKVIALICSRNLSGIFKFQYTMFVSW